MEISIVYDLLKNTHLSKWKKHFTEEDEIGFLEREQEVMQELMAECSTRGKDLVESYRLAMKERIDFVHSNCEVKILNVGIKIGMDLMKAFSEYED